MNRLVYDFITLVLNSLHELVNMYDTYVRVMLIRYSAPYNTIIPFKLVMKMCNLPIQLHWGFPNRPQILKMENITSLMLI